MKGMKEPSNSLFHKALAPMTRKNKKESSIFRSCPLNTVQRKVRTIMANRTSLDAKAF